MITLARYTLVPLAAASALLAAPFSLTSRSDPIGVYGIVDSLVYKPNATNATAVQLWGVFSITEGIPGDHYRPAARGYLYFTVNPSNERAVRAEWADLKATAGKGEVVGFGAHYVRPAPPRLRCATEALSEPDVYAVNIGIVKAVSNPPNTIAHVIRADLASGKAPAAPCRPRGG